MHCVVSCPNTYHFQKFYKISSESFINPVDKQTNQPRQKHNLLDTADNKSNQLIK